MLNKYLIVTKNAIYIRGNRYHSQVPTEWVYAFAADLSQLGYGIDDTVFNGLRNLNETDFIEITADILNSARELVGAHVRYLPLFKNFPHDVPEDYEYLLRRLIGFLFPDTDGNIKLSCGCSIAPGLFNLSKFNACPVCQMQVDELGDEQQKFIRISACSGKKILSCMGHSELKQTFQNVVGSKSSISINDKEFITHLISAFLSTSQLEDWLPESVPYKENVGLVLGELLKADVAIACQYAWQYVDTATDILRVAVQLSGGDVSLAKPSKIKLSRRQRRFIMAVMHVKLSLSSLEEMKPYRSRWLRVAEVIHYGSYKKNYPNAYHLLDALQNKDIKTFNSKIHALLSIDEQKAAIHNSNAVEANLPRVLKLLVTRPGIFARCLNELLSKFDDSDRIITTFRSVADKLTIKTLLQLIKYFKLRSYRHRFRYFMPKGSVAKMKIVADDRKVLNVGTIAGVVGALEYALHQKLRAMPSLGGVYIDAALKNIPVPFTQRSASKTSNPMIRGARIPFDKSADVLRLFMYWKENADSDRIDVDLSAAGYDTNFRFVSHISWTQVNNRAMGVHSGDIQSAPNGASEFIDLDLAVCRQANIRYVAINVYSFTGQTFNTFECFAGLMEKTSVNIDEHYNPVEVKIKFDLTSEKQAAIPLLVDLETAELIWADLASTERTLEAGLDKLTHMCQVISSMRETAPSLYDLFEAHALARGEIYESPQHADIVFKRDDIVQNIDIVLANYL